MTAPQGPRTIAFVLFPEVNILDVTGPVEAFSMAAKASLRRDGVAAYRLAFVSCEGGAVTSSSGMVVHAEAFDGLGPIDTLIVPGGGPPTDPAVPPDLIRQIVQAAPGVRRICSVCTGAFLLAAAGLLKGRRATTHWAAADRLAKEDCGALVDPEPIFIQDGRIWTSAGVTAGIDLALALIEEDMGYATAMSVARSMVVYLRRPGNQSQYSQVLSMQVASDRTFARLHAWVREHLAEDLSVEALAHQVGMSTRSLARHHKTRTGQSPARMVEAFRIEAAVHALEKGDLSLKQIARDCGFGDERTLRRVFLRRFGRAPLDYACGRRTTA